MIKHLIQCAKQLFIDKNKTGVEADNVEDAIKVLQDNKQGNVTGAASTIVSNDLIASRVLTSNSAGKVAVSAVTSAKLEYLNGVTSDVQTQLNAKQATSAALKLTYKYHSLDLQAGVDKTYTYTVSGGAIKAVIPFVKTTSTGVTEDVLITVKEGGNENTIVVWCSTATTVYIKTYIFYV